MDKTKCFAQFAGHARLTIKYSGPGWTILDDELTELLAQYGLACTDRGYDLITRERALVFHPTKRVVRPSPLDFSRQIHGKSIRVRHPDILAGRGPLEKYPGVFPPKDRSKQ